MTSVIVKFDLSLCRILKEPVTMHPIVLYFRKNHFLVQAVNVKLSLFKSAGLIEFFESTYMDKSPERAEEVRKPEILTLYDLSGAFDVWMLDLVLAGMMCAIEVSVELAKKFKLKFDRRRRKFVKKPVKISDGKHQFAFHN
jgi:hypothetical protein